MRIIHIITRMVVGGAQENTMLTVLAQQAAGHEVLLVTGPSLGEEGELETRARALGAKIRVVPGWCESRPGARLRVRRC